MKKQAFKKRTAKNLRGWGTKRKDFFRYERFSGYGLLGNNLLKLDIDKVGINAFTEITVVAFAKSFEGYLLIPETKFITDLLLYPAN